MVGRWEIFFFNFLGKKSIFVAEVARVWVISHTQDLHVISVPIFLNFPLCHAKRSITFQVDNCFFVPLFLCFDSKTNQKVLIGTVPAKTFQDCQTFNFVLLMKPET